MSDRFTEKAENALNKSVKIAEELGHTYIGSEHILLALAEDEKCCASLILKKNGIPENKIMMLVKEYSGTGLKSNLSSKNLTPRARKILESSYDNAVKHGDGRIGTEHILLSLIEERDSVAIKLLKNMRADLNSIRDDTFTLINSRERTIGKVRSDTLPPILKQYGRNLCDLAKEGKFDPVIGREGETDRIVRVLSRKNKNNPCLVGDAGVGKTAIIEGLAQRIVQNKVPPALIGKIIISIDLTSMVAGAKYRGDFEERIKNIINEVIKNRNIILFIDEIHTIVGAGAAEGAIDASNILKPQLARGDMQIIGATTHTEYHKYIERDPALERRFQPIKISEPSEKQTIDMLKALKERYESHHGVKIDDQTINECVMLASRYIPDRCLPDKAIDVLDEACVLALNKSINKYNSSDISKQFAFNKTNGNNCLDLDQYEDPIFLYSVQPFIKKTIPTVTVDCVKDVICEACGIPSHMIRKSIDYVELEEVLNAKIFGQREAISRLVNSIKRSDLGFNKSDRPRGIFLFVGASGTGKTALAIELEKNLYYNSSNLLRYDMSEYSEKHSISKLIGSPPGYVGHDEGGKLTEAVRKIPHAVILFDEIEKADPEILNILLQISDYGFLTDSTGRHVSFKNTIIIATSNIGYGMSNEKVGFMGNRLDSSNDNPLPELKKYFKDELLNRFDEIITFKQISEEVLRDITKEKLKELSTTLKDKGYTFDYNDDIIEHIVSKYSAKGFGARPIIREIASEVEDKIIDLILKSKSPINRIEAIADSNKITISKG